MLLLLYFASFFIVLKNFFMLFINFFILLRLLYANGILASNQPPCFSITCSITSTGTYGYTAFVGSVGSSIYGINNSSF
jgi:hypothetical protein